jgi:prepilin-type N-terminal cleavage/methylation domain-containing protein
MTSVIKKSRGFSLIELLVVISIMMLVLGGGIATYMSFNEKQTVLEATNQLRSYLLQAQSKARNGVMINCTLPLKGYRVSFTNIATPLTINVQELCDDGTPQGVVGSITTHELPQGVSISNFVVTYKVLHGGIVENANSIDVTVSRNNRTYQFAIKNGGELTTGEWI